MRGVFLPLPLLFPLYSSLFNHSIRIYFQYFTHPVLPTISVPCYFTSVSNTITLQRVDCSIYFALNAIYFHSYIHTSPNTGEQASGNLASHALCLRFTFSIYLGVLLLCAFSFSVYRAFDGMFVLRFLQSPIQQHKRGGTKRGYDEWKL